MRLGDNFSLMSIDVESEDELQEASSEVELHGYSVGGTRVPCAVRGTASASLRTPVGSSEPVTGATSAVCTPPHYSTGKGPADEDDKDNDEAPGFHVCHHQRDPWQQDEISMS
jgi:hypothetical protein